MTEEHSEGPPKILTVDEIQKSLPLAAYSAYVQSRVLMYLASDYHCGYFCVDSFSVTVSTGKVDRFRATALSRDRSAGLAPGDEVNFEDVPEGLSLKVEEAKRGCYKVRICWKGDRVTSGQDAIVFDPIVSWEELNKDESCCQKTE